MRDNTDHICRELVDIAARNQHPCFSSSLGNCAAGVPRHDGTTRLCLDDHAPELLHPTAGRPTWHQHDMCIAIGSGKLGAGLPRPQFYAAGDSERGCQFTGSPLLRTRPAHHKPRGTDGIHACESSHCVECALLGNEASNQHKDNLVTVEGLGAWRKQCRVVAEWEHLNCTAKALPANHGRGLATARIECSNPPERRPLVKREWRGIPLVNVLGCVHHYRQLIARQAQPLVPYGAERLRVDVEQVRLYLVD